MTNSPTKNTLCLFACSNDFAFALYVTLQTFFKNSPALAAASDVRVYAYHWSELTKKLIASCGPLEIIDYDLPSFVPRTQDVMRFSPALYARFESFGLLEKYERVLCLDSDILVEKELLLIFDLMKDNIGLVPDTLPHIGRNFRQPFGNYDFSQPCYNAGIIVLKKSKLPLAGSELKTWAYQQLAQQADNCLLGDQGIINVALQHFNLKVSTLSDKWNLPASSSRAKLKRAYIIHSTGHRKFWAYYYFHDFYTYYRKWRMQGGPACAIRTYSDKWKNRWDKKPLPERVFFELAPDPFKYPLKFMVFAIKRLLRVRF